MQRDWLGTGYILGSALVLLIGCVQEPEGYERQARDSAAQPEQVNVVATDDKVKIKTLDDQPVAEFKLDGDQVTVTIYVNGVPSRILLGRTNEKDKRKYEWEDGIGVAEVKPNEDSFKVRTRDGNLLWKVKINPDKVKVSNNEENLNPFELQWKGSDRVKVTLGQTELGEMKVYRDRQKIKVKDDQEQELFESHTSRISTAYGVLLLQTIPEPERYIIMAELLARGK